MSLKTALFSYLSTHASMTPLLGSGANARIYPGNVPEDASEPYIRFRIISSEHVRHMGGITGMAARRVQFDVYGASSLSVESVFSALSTALEAKRGEIGSEDLAVLSSGIETERDESYAPTDGSQIGKEQRSIDFIIWHRL